MMQRRPRPRSTSVMPLRSRNLLQRNFESNGPAHFRVRGKPIQIHDKYVQLARDSASSGDKVLTEELLQHAEHYLRIHNMARDASKEHGGYVQRDREQRDREQRDREQRDSGEDREDRDDRDDRDRGGFRGRGVRGQELEARPRLDRRFGRRRWDAEGEVAPQPSYSRGEEAGGRETEAEAEGGEISIAGAGSEYGASVEPYGR